MSSSHNYLIIPNPLQPSLPLKRHKPQISSIRGISPRERNRYQVVLGDRILGTALTIDEAIELAKGGRS